MLRVVEPRGLAAWICDFLPLRDKQTDPIERREGMRKLFGLLHLAGLQLHADEPVDLKVLHGLEVLVDVRREPGPYGLPSSRIVGYGTPARVSPRN